MSKLDKHWYRMSLLSILLLPLSLLYRLITSIRRFLYRHNVLRVNRFDVPVIVVGNINVGGTGKTPMVVWLITQLQQRGFKPGVVSRGYGGKAPHYPFEVSELSSASEVGDEPTLIFQRTGCPIVVGPDRSACAQALIERFDCNVIISDDGLQHYALGRDIEIVIVDTNRRFGNRWLMPSGPLREPVSRLKQVDFIVENRGSDQSFWDTQQYLQENERLILSEHIQCGSYRLCTMPLQPVNITHTYAENELPNTFRLVCGIGQPSRFIRTVHASGFHLSAVHTFPDHHLFTPADFDAFGDEPIIMTEKDAVKVRAFAKANWFYLPVSAFVDQHLYHAILERVEQLIDKP